MAAGSDAAMHNIHCEPRLTKYNSGPPDRRRDTEADVMDREGHCVEHGGGFGVIKKPWPSMMPTIYNEPDRYLLYWNTIPDVYTAGDVCHKDEDGYVWFRGAGG